MASDSNGSVSEALGLCIYQVTSRHIFTAWFIVYLLFLPVFLLVLYIGFNKWRRPRSSASGGGLSHCDVLTLHMVAMEMVSLSGCCLMFYGYYTLKKEVLSFGAETVLNVTITGQMMFHGLACVERYLAVAHPVTYMRLKREGGVTVRNASIASVWLFSVIHSFLSSTENSDVIFGILELVVGFASIPCVAYCSIYVLCALFRPKPGEKGGHGKQIDQSKRSSVNTMAAILGALLLRLIYHLVSGSIHFLDWSVVNGCVAAIASLWIVLPSGLVLPLLFLHRAGPRL